MFEDKGVFIQQSVYLTNTILHLILLEIFVLNKDSSMQSIAVIYSHKYSIMTSQ